MNENETRKRNVTVKDKDLSVETQMSVENESG